MHFALLTLGLLLGTVCARAAASAPQPLADLLARPILEARQTLSEVQAFTERRVPVLPAVSSAVAWERQARQLRTRTLERVVLRGAARDWASATLRVEWLDPIPGGPGYRIRKLRYEALPDLWVPALLYEPERLDGRVPVVLNVNGHDPVGKAAPYKQVRCINQAKRGLLALNLEWFGMGQLRHDGFTHTRMNQLDLCGTSGVAVHFLALRRALDLLLDHPNADPKRVAVAGLSGGGWQTIFFSALDPRVTACNPVAGYSSFRTRARHLEDLGDPEQTPCDLATVADYTHLTALLAPRPALLTYNAKDDCCFAAAHALPPLLEAARPIYALFNRTNALRSHINHDPGTHNFERENREALYRLLGDAFFPSTAFDPTELPTEGELKTKEQLEVPLPTNNASFHSLALKLSDALAAPERHPARLTRAALARIVRFHTYPLEATALGQVTNAAFRATPWRLRMNSEWSVPALELARGTPTGTTLVLADAGRARGAAEIEALLAAGQRVFALDPYGCGEARTGTHEYLFALLIATVGERPLGVQAAQVAAAARWVRRRHPGEPVRLLALGPRTGMAALVATALEPRALEGVRVEGALATLREVIQRDWTFEQAPELFCFGLLAEADVPQIAALVHPRPCELIPDRTATR